LLDAVELQSDTEIEPSVIKAVALLRFTQPFLPSVYQSEQEPESVCHTLTTIMACITYWQAKEISRVIQKCDLNASNIDLALLEHISPIGCENIIPYGEYVLNRSLVRS